MAQATSYPGSFHYAPRWRKDPGPGWSRVSQILGDNKTFTLGWGGCVLYVFAWNGNTWHLGLFNIPGEYKYIRIKYYVKQILKEKVCRCILHSSVLKKLKNDMSLTTQEETPKKFRRSATNDSSCRLCGSIEDKSHSKNLFKINNHELLNLARSLSGEQLLRHENLPELICRPCERRIGNFKAFRSEDC
jgi:hypothetical protein